MKYKLKNDIEAVEINLDLFNAHADTTEWVKELIRRGDLALIGFSTTRWVANINGLIECAMFYETPVDFGCYLIKTHDDKYLTATKDFIYIFEKSQ